MGALRIAATLFLGVALVMVTVHHLQSTDRRAELGWRSEVTPMEVDRQVAMVPSQDVTFVVRNADPRVAESIGELFDQGYVNEREAPESVSYELPVSSNSVILQEPVTPIAAEQETLLPPATAPVSVQQPTFEVSGELEPVGSVAVQDGERRRSAGGVQLGEHAAKVKLDALARIIDRSEKLSKKNEVKEEEEEEEESSGGREKMQQMVEENKKSLKDLSIAMERQKLVNAGDYKLLYLKLQRVREALHALQLSSTSATSQLKRELLHAQALISRGKSMLVQRQQRQQPARQPAEPLAADVTPECAKAQVFCSPPSAAQEAARREGGGAWRRLGGLKAVSDDGGEEGSREERRGQDQDPETLFSGYHLAGGRHPGQDLNKAREQFLLHSMRPSRRSQDPLAQRRIAISQSLLRTAEGGAGESQAENEGRPRRGDAGSLARNVGGQSSSERLSTCNGGEERGEEEDEEKKDEQGVAGAMREKREPYKYAMTGRVFEHFMHNPNPRQLSTSWDQQRKGARQHAETPRGYLGSGRSFG
ncbi:hypothetical protein GUITHDRAFT_105050 [Guillardia theta CCMP2712]|uniref:Uncharacterized protein n=1 Tax=Guillardia theta (strain CCMP2712) TaxID=905079 RepID=L1JKV6_GUITC|nr:hypothetical protein GUITHDRAFT_105050 [Guillardia theta CCMP2712]EKX48967.1 hypothetical protein GUITHDRAFT_105050 [Guillardia theta CCMP2712]|eukprot:XP_005835947.1 hypothetical protein GUITHDRAFT_105050 [Guillardia theta CCMP2712]